MKRLVVIILGFCLLISLLCSCNMLNPSDHSENTTSDDGLKSPNKDSAETDADNGSVGASDFEFMRHYIDEVYNVHMLSEIVSLDVIEEYTNNIYTKMPLEEANNFPTLYQYIIGLDIEKSSFINANAKTKKFNDENNVEQTTYSDETIELLFCGEQKRMMEGLKSSWAFYHDGKVYTIYDLLELSLQEIKTLAFSKTELIEYLNKMEKALNEYQYEEAANKIDAIKEVLNEK